MGMTEQARLIAERIVEEMERSLHLYWTTHARSDMRQRCERIAFEVMADEQTEDDEAEKTEAV